MSARTDMIDRGTNIVLPPLDDDHISVRMVPASLPAYVSITIDDAWRLRQRIRRLNRMP